MTPQVKADKSPECYPSHSGLFHADNAFNLA